MAVKGGVEGKEIAAELLSELNMEEQERILLAISLRDPAMAEVLRSKMYSFNDLQYLTPSMIQDLMREVSPEELGLAFRACPPEVKEAFFKYLSGSIIRDVEDSLRGPLRSLNDVRTAQERIMLVVKKKIEKGKIVIRRQQDDEYV